MTALDGERDLVVDDEPRYRRLITHNLEAAGYQVSRAATGEEAVDSVGHKPPDLIVLDIQMPGKDGFEVCEEVRRFSTVPIIMLTALSDDEEKVRGLQLGADDYVTKPFSADELLARVEAVLRRARLSDMPTTDTAFECGGLKIDLAARRVYVHGEEIGLTATEYRLLHCLASNPGRVLLQGEILVKVWGAGHFDQHDGLRMYVSRLRQKLEKTHTSPTTSSREPASATC